MSKQTESNQDGGELAALKGTSLADGQVPGRVLVAPWGDVESSSGQFLVDVEAGERVVEAFCAHGTDLPIDFEHQTLGGEYASPSGTAPAAGWITKLEAVEGEGIVAVVNWTDRGRRMIAEKAYRYLSPVALIRKSDRRLVALHSVALTNKPAIVGMQAIVNREGGDALNCDTMGCDERWTTLCQRLRLGRDVGADAILVAATQRIETLEKEAARRDAAALVAEAQSAGKLTEAQREWAMTLAMSDRSLFDEWVRLAPTIVPIGRTDPPAGDAGLRSGGRAASDAARAEYRAHKALHGITSEDAYVADAVRRQQGER